MIRALYTAASGMSAQQLNLDTIANNLANSSTTGFRQLRLEFQDMVYQNLVTPGAAQSQTTVSAGLQIGLGTKSAATEVIMTQGALNQTSNPLDVAIEGAGFFQVQRPDGTIAYTRAGQFQLNNQGTHCDHRRRSDHSHHHHSAQRDGGHHHPVRRGERDPARPAEPLAARPDSAGHLSQPRRPGKHGLEPAARPRSAPATRCSAIPAAPRAWARCSRGTWKTRMSMWSPSSCRWCWRSGPTNRTPKSSRPPTICIRQVNNMTR